MTTTDNGTQVNEVTEAASDDVTETAVTEPAATEATPTVKYPTYRELAFATWKLAYRLSYVEDQFCAEGANEYLEHFGLPRLTHVDGNDELQDSYLTAWFNFHHWSTTGQLDASDNAFLRDRLVRSIRTYLERREPKSRQTMSGWLFELGLEPFAAPSHIGRYNVEHNASTTVNSEMIAHAINTMYPNVNARVSYDRRVR